MEYVARPDNLEDLVILREDFNAGLAHAEKRDACAEQRDPEPGILDAWRDVHQRRSREVVMIGCSRKSSRLLEDGHSGRFDPCNDHGLPVQDIVQPRADALGPFGAAIDGVV